MYNMIFKLPYSPNGCCATKVCRLYSNIQTLSKNARIKSWTVSCFQTALKFASSVANLPSKHWTRGIPAWNITRPCEDSDVVRKSDIKKWTACLQRPLLPFSHAFSTFRPPFCSIISKSCGVGPPSNSVWLHHWHEISHNWNNKKRNFAEAVHVHVWLRMTCKRYSSSMGLLVLDVPLQQF